MATLTRNCARNEEQSLWMSRRTSSLSQLKREQKIQTTLMMFINVLTMQNNIMVMQAETARLKIGFMLKFNHHNEKNIGLGNYLSTGQSIPLQGYLYLCGYKSFRAFLAWCTPLSAAILRRGSTSLRIKWKADIVLWAFKLQKNTGPHQKNIWNKNHWWFITAALHHSSTHCMSKSTYKW